MSRALTKTLLRDAAALLAGPDDDSGYNTYMCHVVLLASTRPDKGRAEAAFDAILKEQDVPTDGSLNKATDWLDPGYISHYDRQFLRFDFLNLLAESL